MNLDPNVAKIIGIDPENAIISPVGGGGCSSASAYKIVGRCKDGGHNAFFMKTGRGSEADIMFEGLCIRACSLNEPCILRGE